MEMYIKNLDNEMVGKILDEMTIEYPPPKTSGTDDHMLVWNLEDVLDLLKD